MMQAIINIISNCLKKLDQLKDIERKEITILATHKKRKQNYCYMTSSGCFYEEILNF